MSSKGILNNRHNSYIYTGVLVDFVYFKIRIFQQKFRQGEKSLGFLRSKSILRILGLIWSVSTVISLLFLPKAFKGYHRWRYKAELNCSRANLCHSSGALKKAWECRSQDTYIRHSQIITIFDIDHEILNKPAGDEKKLYFFRQI